MSLFFPNFLFLDFPESLFDQGSSPGFGDNFILNDNENLSSYFKHFVNTLINSKIFAQDGNLNIVGLPSNSFYLDLSNRLNKNLKIKFFSFELDDIHNSLKKYGFSQGIRDLVINFFDLNKRSCSLVFGLIERLQEFPVWQYLFYPRIAHGLNSQPIWMMKKSWLDNFDMDNAHLIFTYLSEIYHYIDHFPCFLYDSKRIYHTLNIHRSVIDDKNELNNFLLKNQDEQKSDQEWIAQWTQNKADEMLNVLFPPKKFKSKISPIAFQQKLINKAKNIQSKILLVEGGEIRVLQAVNKAVMYGLTGLAVLGSKKKVNELSQAHDLKFIDKIEIIEPSLYHEEFAPYLYDILKKKNITREEANMLIQNDLNLAGTLLKKDIVKGVVAGAHFSTADTLKAAIRIVGVKQGHSLISSFFIMLLPRNVMIFADCAVNPSPDAEQLAEITWQTIESARKFLDTSIYVSMISFSTQGSAQTPEVNKIINTVKLVQAKLLETGQRDVLIEGPVQYDTAINPVIAQKKFQGSKIAGQSNVLIFPNLETGNTVYKAVQQSHPGYPCHCLGPIVQGLDKPYNDLSRGATVDDILQTLFITAIQSA